MVSRYNPLAGTYGGIGVALVTGLAFAAGMIKLGRQERFETWESREAEK